MEPEKKTNGAMVGLIIIILILLVGGIYMWQTQKGAPAPETGTEAPADSAELDSLENDLNSAELDVDANLIENIE